MRAVAFPEGFQPFKVASATKRDPDNPGKGFYFAVNRDFDAAAHKEMLSVDYAVITA